MRTPFSRPIMSGLIAMGVTTATSAISLSNFTPRIENLPSQCQGAYTSQIDGCVAGDFSQGARCSASCVSGLVKISQLVGKQCAGVDVPETSIIGVFLLGQGIPALCPGVAVTTIGSSSSTQAPPPPQTSQAQDSSSQSSPPASTTQNAQSSSTGGIATDPSATLATSINSPNAPIVPPSSAKSSAAATQTASSQKSNQDSGGGSPFDVVATGSSSHLQLLDFSLATVVSMVALAAAVL